AYATAALYAARDGPRLQRGYARRGPPPVTGDRRPGRGAGARRRPCAPVQRGLRRRELLRRAGPHPTARTAPVRGRRLPRAAARRTLRVRDRSDAAGIFALLA